MILGIETAGTLLAVALATEQRILASITVHRKHAHDALLVPLCDDVLRIAGITRTDLRGVAVSAGPGSYTGLRIGMAAAKGIAAALDLPLATIPTTDAAAYNVSRFLRDEGRQLVVAFDARNEEVYMATYRLHAGEAVREHPVSALSTTEAAALVLPEAVLTGDGAELIARHCAQGTTVLPGHRDAWSGDGVALLGERAIARGDIADRAACEPLYLREFQVTRPRSAVDSPRIP